MTVALRRAARFFGDGGLVERYERLGDELMQAGVIASLVADMVPGLSADAVIRRFVFTAKSGAFGLRHYPKRRVVADLVDLDSYGSFAPSSYPLRPSTFTVEMAPRLMRARRSVWVHWLRSQGWPVPPGLADSIMIEHEPAPPDSPAPRLHDPETQRLVHAAAEKSLASGAVPKRRGSKKLLGEKLQQQFPKYRTDTLERYAAGAHAEWHKKK